MEGSRPNSDSTRNHGRYAALKKHAIDSYVSPPDPIQSPADERTSPPDFSCERGIFPIDNFVPETECSEILTELQYSVWRQSLTYERHADGEYRDQLTSFRSSETAHQAWFSPVLKDRLAEIESRLENLLEADRANLEDWQATRYAIGDHFDYHLDSGYWGKHPAGERVFTILLYLATPECGGGTHFRAQDVHIGAKSGRLVVWDNLFSDGRCDRRMIHSSVPVVQGRKLTLVTWLRQNPFRN